VDISGVAVHLQKVTIGVTGRYGPKPAFGALLCSTAKVVGSNPPTDAVAAALNDVLHLMALPKYFRPSRES
jgi:hypothetical protein